MATKKMPRSTNPERKPATERYKVFAASYLANGRNATQAALDAGYSPKTAAKQGSRLSKNVEVQKLIDDATKEVLEEKKITVNQVLDVIIETMNRCRQAAPVLNRKGEQIFVETPDGQIVPAFTFNAKGVLMATDQLGRHLKMFTDKTELTTPPGQPLEAVNMTLEEAQKRYQAVTKLK